MPAMRSFTKWFDLLAATVTIVDLYDAARVPGEADHNQPISAGGREALAEKPYCGSWVAAAANILERLAVRDEETPRGWVAANSLYEEIRQLLPGITEVDFDFLLLTLARRFPLKIPGVSAREKDTNLIERQRGGSSVRLAKRGRSLVFLVESFEDWLDADIDMEKVLRAIQLGEFGKALRYSENMARRAQDSLLLLKEISEQPTREGMKAELVAQEARYVETTQNIMKAASDALASIGTADTREKFEEWMRRHTDAGDWYIEQDLRNVLEKVLGLIVKIDRLFMGIVQEFSSDKPGLAKPANFASLAKVFLLEKRDPERYVDALLVMNGFFWPEAPALSAEDFVVKVRVEKKQERPKPVEIPVGAKQAVRKLREVFLERFGTELARELAQGPVQLRDLISEGLFDSGDLEGLGLLVGVYVDASLLGIGVDRLLVACDSGAFRSRTSARKLEMSNLTLHLMREEA